MCLKIPSTPPDGSTGDLPSTTEINSLPMESFPGLSSLWGNMGTGKFKKKAQIRQNNLTDLLSLKKPKS